MSRRAHTGKVTVVCHDPPPLFLLCALKDGPHAHRALHLGVKRIFLKSDYDLTDLLACVNELSAPVSAQQLSAIPAHASSNG